MIIAVAVADRRLVPLLLMLALIAYPQFLQAQKQDLELDLLLLEVRLDQSVLSGAIPAYDKGEHILLPLGELARLLTLAIQTQPREGTASGFILNEDRGFSLNLSEARVTRAGVTEAFDPALVLSEPDDLYVAKELLELWLPLELEINRSSQSLRVYALEELPLQARLRRENFGGQAGRRGRYEDPGYPHYKSPYLLLSMPFIDQTLATELRANNEQTWTDTRYTAFLAGDLLGMESSVFFSASKQEASPEVRVTLGRHDPDAGLLGPLSARSYSFGSLTAPSVDNISRSTTGEGVTVSNRPLTQPTNFDRQTFEGDLPPGWDVELYYNDALVDFQQAREDGLYRFEDQPLSYGRNDFQLVFNGPLGQTRVEQYSFSLDQSMARPGEFRYSLTEQRDEDDQSRSVAQFDLGIARNLSASAGFVRAPVEGAEQQYTSLGLRTFWQALSVSGDFIQAEDGGSLTELDLQTKVGGLSIDAGRARLNDFKSEIFNAVTDPVRTRDEVRLSGAIPLGPRTRLPVTIYATRDELESGINNIRLSNRISAYVYRTALTNTLEWQSLGDSEQTLGSFQVSRRIRDFSLRSQINYTLNPDSEVSSMAFTADKYLMDGYRFSLGVAHTYEAPLTTYSAGFTKSLGRYGLGVNARYMSNDDYAIGAQFFMGMGREPRQSDWLFDARPMANYGAVSARMFLDENNNGIMDKGEQSIPDAGFTVNGGRRQARTNAEGIAHLGRLPVKQYADIGVDISTLIDPQWQPQRSGVRLVPRPGHVVELEFPVQMTSEIDGTVFLLNGNTEQGIGGLKLELLDDRLEVVGQTTSTWDGFYIVPAVLPGDYWLRVSPEQLRRLDLEDTGFRVVKVLEDGAFVSGMDMWVVAASSPLSRPVPDQPLLGSRARVAVAGNSNNYRQESWIRSQPGSNFTIQLMAASSENAVRNYIDDHGLKGHAAYFRSEYREAPWYSVIYGSFATYEEARRSLEGLPLSFKTASPWVRRYGGVQGFLK
ncbi:SPOR domain-containing protein [Marinobacter sp.]|uniref:SPOR domain-containing protein n=1 Tax=Marinobacter sp. TaxID=50741 RepID=UPI003A915F42